MDNFGGRRWDEICAENPAVGLEAAKYGSLRGRKFRKVQIPAPRGMLLSY